MFEGRAEMRDAKGRQVTVAVSTPEDFESHTDLVNLAVNAWVEIFDGDGSNEFWLHTTIGKAS